MLKMKKIMAVAFTMAFCFSLVNGNLTVRADEVDSRTKEESIKALGISNQEINLEDKNKDRLLEEDDNSLKNDQDVVEEAEGVITEEKVEDINSTSSIISGITSTVTWGNDRNYNWVSGKCTINGIEFTMNSDNNTAYISDCSENLSGSLYLPNNIRIGGSYYRITSIGRAAFYGSKLTSITMPSSVTSMGQYSFSYSSIADITMPSSLESIDANAFLGCGKLIDITIPSGVTRIADSAFTDCHNLMSIYIDYNNRNYSSENGVLFNKDKTTIVRYPEAKQGTSYIIPRTVTNIGNRAFRRCTGLRSIEIPSGVISIGLEGFYHCENLTSITIPNNIVSIGDWAFTSCKSFTSVTIPSSVESIGIGVFADCTAMTNMYVDPDNENYTDENGIVFNKDKTMIVECPEGNQMTSYKIPSSVTSIGDYAFYGSSKLISITIPNSVTFIGDRAFCACKKLKSIIIPDSVTDIVAGAFINCDSLSSVWSSLDEYNRIRYAFNLTLIESNLYDRHNYVDDVIKIKADSVTCFEKCSEGTEQEIDMIRDEDGYFVHDPDKSEEGIRYYYYKAVIDGITYESPEISVEVNNTTEGEEIPTWNENNETVVGGITYIKNDDGTISVKGNQNISGEVEIPSSIRVDGIDESVKNVELAAFLNCTDITKVIIPDSIETMGESVFSGCSSLREVMLPNRLTSIENCTFDGCRELDNIELPDSVDYIGMFSFKDCTSLRDITIPVSVTTIDNGAFWYCISLETVEIQGDDVEIGEGAFFYCNSCNFKVKNQNIKNKLMDIGISEDKIIILE